MKAIRVLATLAGLLLTMSPAVLYAQPNCPNPLALACGDSISGNNCGGLTSHNRYPCLEYLQDGPESVYLLTLEHDSQVTITLQPDNSWLFGWDGSLIVMADLDGECYLPFFNGCSDVGGSGGTEELTGILPAGTYFVVVDAYYGIFDNTCGDFDLHVQCIPCTQCTDADLDGHDVYDAANCPCGDDCCDAGDEPVAGCTVDSASDIHGGAADVCGDGVDNSCAGADTACPPCGADAAEACTGSGSVNTASQGTNEINDYCDGLGASNGVDWRGPEYIFGFTSPDDALVTVTTTNLDIIVTGDYGDPAVCDPDACLAVGGESFTDAPPAKFIARAGEEYFISLDGLNGASGNVDYTITCEAPGACVPGEAIACDQTLPGNTTGLPNNMEIYNGIVYALPGPEYVFSFTAAAQTYLIADLTTQPNIDLALVALRDVGSGCTSVDVIAGSDLDNRGAGDWTEQLAIVAQAGETIYVVVDAWQSTEYGSFDLHLTCITTCEAGMSRCGSECVDLQADLNHCGTCGHVCNFANAPESCVDGTCVMGACDAGFDDCNTDEADGCEADLGTLAHCGACDNACAYDHAAASCTAGACAMGACDAGWGDCNSSDADGCEMDLTTDTNCGSCGNACTDPAFCHDGSCVSDCPGGLSRCGDACIDTTADVNNCGDCDVVCVAAHATPGCAGSVCTVAACDAGWGDCDAEASNGCEVQLGTDANCTACGDTCEFPNGTGRCEGGQCVLGPCVSGWANCNGIPADGCEASLDSTQTCGSCSVTCTGGESCINGECREYCEDTDSDGHEDINCGGDDCNDGNADIHPGASEVCGDTIDQDCDGEDEECTCPDRDGDGYRDAACGGDDCNDLDGYIQPGVQEDCTDDRDQDCDELVDCADSDCSAHPRCTCPDADGDGHHAVSCGGDDCDDAAGSVHPGAFDDCGDGFDQNCDGVDRACPSESTGCGCGGAHRPGVQGNGAGGNSRPGWLVLLAGCLLFVRRIS